MAHKRSKAILRWLRRVEVVGWTTVRAVTPWGLLGTGTTASVRTLVDPGWLAELPPATGIGTAVAAAIGLVLKRLQRGP